MVILSQDRTVIINFDTGIDTIERNGHKIIAYFHTPHPYMIGDYPNDKRAQEVLEELFDVLNNPVMVDKHNTYDTVHSYFKTFEM